MITIKNKMVKVITIIITMMILPMKILILER